jgi:hypothetical protein
MMALRSVVVVLLSLLSITVACTSFDREDRIEDTRVLAVEVTPPEILYSPLFLTPPALRPFPLFGTTLEVKVHAFDPRGGTVRTSRSARRGRATPPVACTTPSPTSRPSRRTPARSCAKC